jgi:hypothetical protein
VSLFVCDSCNVIANTATDKYWKQSANQEREGVSNIDRKFYCSLCLTGKWHGRFPRDDWDGTQRMLNRPAL